MNDATESKGVYVAKKEDIVADLKNLLETDVSRTKMGRVWEVYEDIVALQQAGVSMKKIEARLNERGFDLKPGNLASYLYQIRKKKGIEKMVAVETKPKRVKPKAKTPATPDVVGEEKSGDAVAATPIEAAGTSKRPPPLLSDEKGVWGKLKPSRVDGTVDLKQK